MKKPATSAIHFHYVTDPFVFRKRTVLKRYILKMLKAEGRAVEAINYILCSDEYLLDVNQRYLTHDTYTDIITFELSPRQHPILADIFISVDRVKENARTFKTHFSDELRRVIFHGALHLCGYKDKSPQASVEMRGKEQEWLFGYRRFT